jgi:polar amino acid transport system substrate-binding protein
VKIRVAFVDEPPFYSSGDDGPHGSDIELADVVLRAIGATSIKYRLVAFEELLPGVQAGRWDINVPIFVTPERARDVAFSVPVWSLGDGFLVARGNPKQLTSYRAVAERDDARLGIIPGQVQVGAASSAGVRDDQLIAYTSQAEAVSGLLAGRIDAFAATAVGNRVVVETEAELESVAIESQGDRSAPVGAFSLSAGNRGLLEPLNAELRAYLGSSDHRTRMAAYGITAAEIDPVLMQS